METVKLTPMSDPEEGASDELEKLAIKVSPTSNGQYVFLCLTEDGRVTASSNITMGDAIGVLQSAIKMLAGMAPTVDPILNSEAEVPEGEIPCHPVKH